MTCDVAAPRAVWNVCGTCLGAIAPGMTHKSPFSFAVRSREGAKLIVQNARASVQHLFLATLHYLCTPCSATVCGEAAACCGRLAGVPALPAFPAISTGAARACAYCRLSYATTTQTCEAEDLVRSYVFLRLINVSCEIPFPNNEVPYI